MPNIDQELLRRKLDELRLEHRDLDDVIHRMQMTGGLDQMQMQRLKKRIIKIENQLIPDILA